METAQEQPERELYNKKGQTQGAVGAVVGLIVGVGVAVLILIFVGVLGGQAYNIAEPNIDVLSGSIVNESFTATNNTQITLAHHNIDNSSFNFFNASSGTEIGVGNFTLNPVAGKITFLATTPTGAGYNLLPMGVNYSYGDATMEASIKNGITQGFGALEDTGTYLPLIVLGIVIFIILGLVLGMTAFGGNNGGMQSAL